MFCSTTEFDSLPSSCLVQKIEEKGKRCIDCGIIVASGGSAGMRLSVSQYEETVRFISNAVYWSISKSIQFYSMC